MHESDVQIVTAEYERLRRLSDLDQTVAKAKDNVRSATVKLADSIVELGRVILKSLAKEGCGLRDDHARHFIKNCTRLLHDKLLRDGKCDLSRHDEKSAKLYYEQARRVTEIMLTVQKGWPWRDERMISKAVKQINNGQSINVRDIIAEIQN